MESVGEAGGLVTVIVPVLNGEATLGLVLEGLLSQSHRQIEVLISDNASTDSTPEICAAAMSRDARVRYVRQRDRLTAIANFRWWLNEARGDYVVFAAHDDLRNRTFIRALLTLAVKHPEASCIVPAVYRFSEYSATPFAVNDPVKETCRHYSTVGLGLWQRLGFVVANGFPFYGLIKRDALLAYPWPDIDYAPDMPLVLFLALFGEVLVNEEASLFYFVPAASKSHSDRAATNSLRRLALFPELRLAWECGKVAAAARRARGHHLPVAVAFVGAWLYRTTPRVRGAAYDLAPHWLRSVWRRLKGRVGWRLN